MKKNTVFLIVAASAIVLIGIIYLFGFSPVFHKSISGALSAAVQSGKLEITTDADAQSYFTFVSAEEARKMLADADSSGQPKFLMPQFDIPESGLRGITIRNSDKDVDGVPTKFLVISGLPANTVIYANSDRPGQGGVTAGDNAFAWYRTADMTEDISTITYIPAALFVRPDGIVLLSGINDLFTIFKIGTPIFKLVTEGSLDPAVFPDNAEVAFAITRNGQSDFSDMKNLLMKDGRIVMVNR